MREFMFVAWEGLQFASENTLLGRKCVRASGSIAMAENVKVAVRVRPFISSVIKYCLLRGYIVTLEVNRCI